MKLQFFGVLPPHGNQNSQFHTMFPYIKRWSLLGRSPVFLANPTFAVDWFTLLVGYINQSNPTKKLLIDSQSFVDEFPHLCFLILWNLYFSGYISTFSGEIAIFAGELSIFLSEKSTIFPLRRAEKKKRPQTTERELCDESAAMPPAACGQGERLARPAVDLRALPWLFFCFHRLLTMVYFSIDWECHHPISSQLTNSYYWVILGIIIPTDELIFFRGVYHQPV